MKYKKTLEDLERVAIKWWPKDLEAEVARLSVVPKLLETQEQFVAVLKLCGSAPEQIFDVILASKIPPNLFLKHLVVLADYGGELIKRLGKEFKTVFPIEGKSKRRQMHYLFAGQAHCYQFKKMPVVGLSNAKLMIDGEGIVHETPLDDLAKDLIMILLYGGASTANHLAALEKCDLGGLLGRPDEIDR